MVAVAVVVVVIARVGVVVYGRSAIVVVVVVVVVVVDNVERCDHHGNGRRMVPDENSPVATTALVFSSPFVP